MRFGLGILPIHLEPDLAWASAYKYGDQIADRHMDGLNVIFCDGHVKWMKKSALSDYNHNGVVDNGWFDTDKSKPEYQ